MNEYLRQQKAKARWERMGPYLAMFPYEYAVKIVNRYTKEGDAVLDPFAGRFSSVVAASYSGRLGVGIEISPVGFVYGSAKISPAQKCGNLSRRIAEMSRISGGYWKKARDMDEFFRMCYCDKVLRFLLACRDNLNWKTGIVDATLMAQILTSLHHGKGRGLSNQMHQVKSMSPNYSVNWWKGNGLNKPPDINPKDFLGKRLEWRYKYGTPSTTDGSRVHFRDSASFLDAMPLPPSRSGKFKLLLTSPPYHNMVNYHKDQWLRLWLLGGEPYPQEGSHKHKKRFSNKDIYKSLLESVFGKCATMMDDNSVIVVRTSARPHTDKITRDVLCKNFPRHKVWTTSSIAHQTQSALFNKNITQASRERDLILTPH